MVGYWVAVVLTVGAAAGQRPEETETRLLDLANSHYRERRPHEAVRLYREYLDRYRDRADVRVYLGAALLNLNDPAGALEEARRAVGLDGSYSKAYTLAARVYAERQEWALADEFFSKAVDLDPSDRDAWYFRGRALYEANRFERAIAALLRAVALGAEHSFVYEKLGLAHEAVGEISKAEGAHKRAVRLGGGGYRPCFAYGAFLFRQNRIEESVSMLRRALESDPNSVEVRFELGRVLYQSGRFSQAIEILDPVAALGACRILNLRIRILMAMGNERDAETEIERFRLCIGDGVGEKP